MLRIEGLKVCFGKEPILNGVDLQVEKGESVAIIGESGAGKTTLGLSIMGLLNGNAQGTVDLDGLNILSLAEGEIRRVRGSRISMAFQSSRNQLNPSHRIIDQVAEPIIAHRKNGKNEAHTRASAMLVKLGLSSEKFSHYPHQLSGGEQQRVLLAMALAGDPELVILDEPISSLDAASRIEVTAFLQKALVGRMAILVTHDFSTAAKLASMIATLYGGRIIECGPTQEMLSHPRHPYTRALIRSYPNMTTTKDLQGIKGRMERDVSGCAFHPRCTQAVALCREEVPSLSAHNGRWVACHRGGLLTALSAHNLSKSFGKLKAVDGASLTLEHGETLALVGESGSGKTTLARMIVGILKADTGEVFVEGERVDQRGKNFHRAVQMVFQNPGEALSHRLTVLEAVREPLEIQGVGSKADRDKMAMRVIDEVELPTTKAFLDEYPHHLSGGELQRVNIARALVLNPKVLIADEPTAFLDSSVKAKIMKLLLNLQENRGLTILFITHDIAVARKVSDRIAVMREGKIVEEGSVREVMENPLNPYTRRLIEAASDLDSERMP